MATNCGSISLLFIHVLMQGLLISLKRSLTYSMYWGIFHDRLLLMGTVFCLLVLCCCSVLALSLPCSSWRTESVWRPDSNGRFPNDGKDFMNSLQANFKSPVHVILSRFYLDFILILSWFYPDFILILSKFYPDILEN